jgi:XTP/dITP diphosphohydrolase
VIGFQKPKTEPEIFLGIVKGQIALEELGNNGFAFDPIFVPQGYEETFGQLTSDIKNQFSHRRKSLEKFAIYYKDTKGD